MHSLLVQALAVLSALVSRSITLLVLFVAARGLPPEEFSAFALTLSIATVVVAVVSGGGDLWLNRFSAISRRLAARAAELRSRYLLLSAALAAVMCLLIVAAVASGLIVDYLARALAIGLFGAVVAGLCETCLAVLRAEGRVVSFYAIRDLVTPIAFLAAIWLYGGDTATSFLWPYLGVWLGALLVSFLMISWTGAVRFARPARAGWPLVKLGRHTMVLLYGNLTSRLAAAADVVLLSFLLEFERVGDYRVAAQISIGFLVIQHFAFLALPWQLRSSRPATVRDTGSIVRTVQLRLVLAAAAALAALLYFAPDLLRLFNERFVAMAPVLSILLCLRFVNLLWGPQHEMLVSNGLAVRDGHSNFFGLVAYLATFFPLLAFGPVLFAAVAAHVAGSACAHYYRHRVLLQANIARQAGGGRPLVQLAGYVAVAGYVVAEAGRLN